MIYSYIIVGYLYFVFLIVVYKQQKKNKNDALFLTKTTTLYNKSKIYNFSRTLDRSIYFQNININILIGTLEINLIYKKKCYTALLYKLNRQTLFSKIEIENKKIYIKITSFASNIILFISNIKKLKLLTSINIKTKNKCYQVNKSLKKVIIISDKTTYISSSAIINKARIYYKENLNKFNILLYVNKNTSLSFYDIGNIVFVNSLLDYVNYSTICDNYSYPVVNNIQIGDNYKNIDIAINKLNFTFSHYKLDFLRLKNKAISEFIVQNKITNFSEYINIFDTSIFLNFSYEHIKLYCFSKKLYCLFLKYFLSQILGIKIRANTIKFLKINSQISFDILINKQIINIKRSHYNIDFIKDKIQFRNLNFIRI